MSFVPIELVADNATVVTAMKLILVTSVMVGVSASILAWRARPEPGSTPLVFLLVGQCWWSVTILFRLNATSLGGEVFWLHLSWLGTVVIPVAWLFFCLEYTGHHEYVQPRYVILASVIPVLTAAISLTNQYHYLLYVDTPTLSQTNGTILVRTPGVWYWVIAAYTYLLGVLGAIPLLRFITSDVQMFRGQSLALLTGLVVPWATNLLYLTGSLPTGGVDPTPAAFTVSGVAYLGSITRFQLFGTNPAPIRQARYTVFEGMQDGAVVVDNRDHIVEVNRQAAQIFDMESTEILGRPVADVIPNINRVSESETRAGQTMLQTDHGPEAYDVAVTPLTNVRDRPIGRIITLHDISDYLRQQQRLEVLNRVFRHNIRTHTQVILGKADYLADHNSAEEAANVQENAMEIQRIGNKVRTVLDVFEQSRKETQLVSLDALLRECISDVREEYPDVTVTYDPPSEQVYVSAILEQVFTNLVDNAAAHNTDPDPQVRIEVRPDGDRSQVVVADNGPGVDEKELTLLNEGGETPLEHGSGFGLAIIIWGTEIAGGEITFEENDPSGLVATVGIPTYSETGQSRDDRYLDDLLPGANRSD
jgi:PAS domain S-box-containing protein